MPVGHRPAYNYYSINKNGKIRSTSGDDKNEEYDFLWGILSGIDLQKDEWEGEVIYKYHFKLEDPIEGGVDILQVGEASSAARGIIMSLMGLDKICQVKFTPFTKTSDGRTYTNVWVEHRTHVNNDWEKCPEWAKDVIDHLPDVNEVELSDGRSILDDGERRKYIRGLAARIKKTKLNTLPESTGTGLNPGERVDDRTGEVIDHSSATNAAYGAPAPEKVKQKPEELHADDFDDMDDDLPF